MWPCRFDEVRDKSKYVMPPPPKAEPSTHGAETRCYFTEMCSSAEAGSYFSLIDFVCHSTLGLRVIKKLKKVPKSLPLSSEFGTNKTDRTRFWPWLSGKSP